MAVTRLGNYFGAVTAIDAAAASTSAPSAGDDYFHSDSGPQYTGTVRCYVHYTGDPTAGNLIFHAYDGTRFYAHTTTALDPATDEVVDFTVGNGARFGLQLTGLTFDTSGTVTVNVEQV